MKKQCQYCGKMKFRTEFFRYQGNKDGLGSYCKKCKVILNKKSEDKRLEKYRERFLEQRKSNHLKTAYGIDIKTYKAILNKQRGLCAICLEPPSTRKLAVDHDHKTGKIRGLLCKSCNQGIGMFKDNPQLLRNAQIYLKNWY